MAATITSSPGPLKNRCAWAYEVVCEQQKDLALNNGRVFFLNPETSAYVLSFDNGTGIVRKDDNTKKRASLLSASLTQSDGEDWQRQRPAVVAAIGGGITIQQKRHGCAAMQAADLADNLAANVEGVPDVMDFSLRIAARGIVASVAGSSDDIIDRNKVLRLETLLVQFQKASRKRANYDAVLAQSLENQLKVAINDIFDHYLSHSKDGSANSNALLDRLLQRKELSKEEVIANVNSCLLAGVETTSILLGCSLLRLANRPLVKQATRREILEIQSQGQGETTKRSKLVSAIMKETLRIHPPVMGLPRCVSGPQGLSLPDGTVLPQGTKFSVCLLAAKTVHPRPMCSRQAEGEEREGGEVEGGNAVTTEVQEHTSQTYQSNMTVCAPSTPPPPLMIVPPTSPPPTTTPALPSASVPAYITSPTLNESPIVPKPTATPTPAPPQTVTQSFMRSYLSWQWWSERFPERFNFFRTGRPTNIPNIDETTSLFINRSPVDNVAYMSTLSPEQQAFIANKKAEILKAVERTWEWEIDLSGGSNDDTVVEQSSSSSSSSSMPCIDNPLGAPFGMGPRACPAGSLSMVITRQVLETLLVKYDWTFVNEQHAATEQWVQDLASAPTLVVKGPIALTFNPIN